MPPTFLLEAFGQLSPGSKLSGIDSGERKGWPIPSRFRGACGIDELVHWMGPQPPPIALEYV